MPLHTKAHNNSLRAVIAAICANFLVTIAKFIGWYLSFSPSMLAEAIHSLADTLNQCLLFVGIQHGSGKPTRRYPWGKGQARYIWNLVSAMGIFFVGFGFTTYHGIQSIIYPQITKSNGSFEIPIIILCFSLLAEGYSLIVAIHSINETKGEQSFWQFIFHGDDPTSVAIMFEDSIAVLGVILAFIGIWFSQKNHTHVPDAIAATIIGCLLGVMAIVLAVANGRILMGVSASIDWETSIREFVESYPSVEHVASLKTAVLAPGRVRLSIEVEFHGGILINRQQIEKDAEQIRKGDDPTYILVETAERMVRTVGREINKLEADIHKEFPEIVMIDLEVN